MNLQYCVRRGSVSLSLLELSGTLHLSYRQAEGRRAAIAFLCLKYMLSLGAVLAAGWLYVVADGGRPATTTALCAVIAALTAVATRGALAREMYLLSAGFLRAHSEGSLPRPDLPVILSGELVLLAVRGVVSVLMMSPAFLCLRSGIRYYSLSADRRGFMLLLAASALLAAGGMIFAAVIRARLGCAEYLWLSGQCPHMLSALDGSWELTCGSGGDMLRLRLLSSFSAPGMSALCAMNFSQYLLRVKGLPDPGGLRVRLVRDFYGEQRLEIV